MQGIVHRTNGVRCLGAQYFKTVFSHFYCGRRVSNHIILENNERKVSFLSKSSWYDSKGSHFKKINEKKSYKSANRSGWACSSVVAATAVGYSLYKVLLDGEKTEKDIQPDPLKITVCIYPIIGKGCGSGFYFDDKGHIITCAHVASIGSLWYCTSLSNSGIYTVGATDDKTDVAVLNPVYRTKQPGSLESYGYHKAESTISFFKPTNLSAYDYTTGEFITSRQRFGGVILSTDELAVNLFVHRGKPGFSGGLITSNGHFKGILKGVLDESSPLSAEIYVPAKTVDYCAKSLIEYGRVVHYKLGIELIEDGKELKVISSTNKKILDNDKILALNSKKVASVKDFAQALPETETLSTSSSEKELILLLEREGIAYTVLLPISESEKSYHNSFKHGSF